ncbi:hypothetical protein OsI_01505 [Oryza sativa Indica Group]|uniref:Uncharacterized protein n=2 Tax=Oryza TaxID=4527 RepID=A0A0E0FKH6_ORYNI|nr:hypothetical protein OsI_01505 [Oryza sativa Indica Group]
MADQAIGRFCKVEAPGALTLRFATGVDVPSWKQELWFCSIDLLYYMYSITDYFHTRRLRTCFTSIHTKMDIHSYTNLHIIPFPSSSIGTSHHHHLHQSTKNTKNLQGQMEMGKIDVSLLSVAGACPERRELMKGLGAEGVVEFCYHHC